MAETIDLNISIDKDLKERAETVFYEMGMNMSTAINIFVRQTIRQGKIPFDIYADPFYSDNNMKVLLASIADMDAGRGIVRKTMEELRAMEND
jgi:DNA-damage-inducible protein J